VFLQAIGQFISCSIEVKLIATISSPGFIEVTKSFLSIFDFKLFNSISFSINNFSSSFFLFK